MLGIVNFSNGYAGMYDAFLVATILTFILVIIFILLLLLIAIPTAWASKYNHDYYYKCDTIFTIIAKIGLGVLGTGIIHGLITLYAYIMKS